MCSFFCRWWTCTSTVRPSWSRRVNQVRLTLASTLGTYVKVLSRFLRGRLTDLPTNWPSACRRETVDRSSDSDVALS